MQYVATMMGQLPSTTIVSDHTSAIIAIVTQCDIYEHMLEEQMVRICLYVYVCVASPMIVGAWLMAVMLW